METSVWKSEKKGREEHNTINGTRVCKCNRDRKKDLSGVRE